MASFEEVKDTFETMGEDAGNALKNIGNFISEHKGLFLVVGGIGVIAFYVWYTNRFNNEETVSTYAYVPTGYAGLPQMSDGSSDSYYDYMESITNQQDNFINETLSEVSQIIEQMQSETEKHYESVIDNYETQLQKYDESLSFLQEQRERDKLIAEAQNNSNLWHLTDDAETKEALHLRNVELMEQLGATFDSASGQWLINGKNVYDVTVSSTSDKTNVGVSSSSSSSSSNSSTDIITQMKQNSDAWHSADADTKKMLEAQNQELGKSIGASFDSASGTWTLNGQNIYDLKSETLKDANYDAVAKTETAKFTSSSSSSKSSSSSSKSSGTSYSKTQPSSVPSSSKYQNTSKQQAWADKLTQRANA